MDLVSGQFLWRDECMDGQRYPKLTHNIETEIAIVGGGISGAILSEAFVDYDIPTVLVDQRRLGTGSTSASTMLLQYEIDTDLCKLSKMIGKEKAIRAFKLCVKAIDEVEQLVKKYNLQCDYEKKNSLYVASRWLDIPLIKKEFRARKDNNFKVDYLDQKQIERIFPFSYPCGIYNHHGATMQPVKFTRQLIKKNVENGLRVYEHSPILFASPRKDGIVLHGRNFKIKAKKAIFCTGYESFQFIKNKGYLKFQNTYVVGTRPCQSLENWYQQCMIWESARPYRYIRSTVDNRIVIGGLDDPYKGTRDRLNKMNSKGYQLMKKLRELFPDIPNLEAEYLWAGMFGTTNDGLAYIGENPQLPNAYFSLGFGGNGALYSIIARDIIRDLYLYSHNPDASIFSFDR